MTSDNKEYIIIATDIKETNITIDEKKSEMLLVMRVQQQG